jgi:hypothetical protein
VNHGAISLVTSHRRRTVSVPSLDKATRMRIVSSSRA